MTHPWAIIKARRTDRLLRKHRPVGTPSYWYTDDPSLLERLLFSAVYRSSSKQNRKRLLRGWEKRLGE